MTINKAKQFFKVELSKQTLKDIPEKAKGDIQLMGFELEKAEKELEKKGGVFVEGRYDISNDKIKFIKKKV